jgi:hypothetical protein
MYQFRKSRKFFLLRNTRVKEERATSIFAVDQQRCRKSQINEISNLFHAIN